MVEYGSMRACAHTHTHCIIFPRLSSTITHSLPKHSTHSHLAQGVNAMTLESKLQVTIKIQKFTNSGASEITSLSELQVPQLTRIFTSRVLKSKHDKTLRQALSKALNTGTICTVSYICTLKPFIHACNQYESIYWLTQEAMFFSLPFLALPGHKP